MEKSKTTECPHCHSKDDYYLTQSGQENCTNCEKIIWVGRIDGGPAFSVSNDAEDEGMSLRDYFAIHTDVSDFKFQDQETFEKFTGIKIVDIESGVKSAATGQAKLRYAFADAMLKESRK